MNTRLLFLLLCFAAALDAASQKTTLLGSVVNAKDGSPIELATVRLLQLPDSSLVDGVPTDSLGGFVLRAPRSGKYVLKANYIGFSSDERLLELAADADTIRLGQLRLAGEGVALRAAVVTATLARVEQKEDTTIFNASAFRTPEGSTLEALVKQLPGAEVAEDGSIKVNGKKVQEFLINGKDFFKGDTKVAMKNLPTHIVSKLKAYDKKSEYTELTGIDDGEETFVLDISTKRELNQSFVSNIDLGGGRAHGDMGVYSGKVFASRFTDRSRVSFFASHNNLGDRSFGGPRGMRTPDGGITTSSMAGADFAWDNGKKKFSRNHFEVSGNALFYRSDNDAESTSAGETFLSPNTSKSSFTNARRQAEKLDQSVYSRFRLKWSPDTLTSISLRPSFSWNRSGTSGFSRTAGFDENPFERYALDDTDDILDRAFRHQSENGRIETTDDFLVNLNRRNSLGQSTSHSLDGRFELTRRYGGKGSRSFSVQAQGGYTRSESHAYSKADIYTRSAGLAPSVPGRTVLKANGTHQFSPDEAKSWNYRIGGSYVEPIAGKLLAELRYNYEHRFHDSDRSLYNLHDLRGYNTLADFLSEHPTHAGIAHVYRPGDERLISWADPAMLLSQLNADDLQAALRDAQNSQYATYNYYNHHAQIRFRLNDKQLNMNVGLGITPERTRLEYERPLVGTIDTVRNVVNLAPHVRFRYNFSKTRRLDIFYRGSSTEPAMTRLLNIVDSSDPLDISVGNPGLKPSWNDIFRAHYNDYDPETRRGIMTNVNFNQTRNAVADLLVYDTASGRRFTRPENISGSWEAGGGMTLNTPIVAGKPFDLSTATNVAHRRSVGYIATSAPGTVTDKIPTLEQVNRIFDTASPERNVNRSTTLAENLDLSYRRPLWDVTLSGNVNYHHSRSSLQPRNNLDTWSFAYGVAANLVLDNGLSLSTDLRMHSRRGFSSSALNTNEFVWNAQFSKAFLADKSLSVSLRFYDLLRRQSNISRTINAMMRTDARHNGIHSYVMLHVIYKLNIFGGTKGAKHPDNRKESDAPEHFRPSLPPGALPGSPSAPLPGHPYGRPGF